MIMFAVSPSTSTCYHEFYSESCDSSPIFQDISTFLSFDEKDAKHYNAYETNDSGFFDEPEDYAEVVMIADEISSKLINICDQFEMEMIEAYKAATSSSSFFSRILGWIF